MSRNATSRARSVWAALAAVVVFSWISFPPAFGREPHPTVPPSAGETRVAAGDYTHFPRLARGRAGRLGVLYYHGFNHGSGDSDGIASAQRPAQRDGRFALDGRFAVNGAAMLPTATQVTISFEADESARTFTLTGEDQSGKPVTERLAGSAGKRVHSRTRFGRITAIAVDGPTAGRVSVGPRVVASQMMFSASDDGGKSWSQPFAIADGIRGDPAFYYVGALGGLPDGTFIAIYVRVDPEGGRGESFQRVSHDNGRTWSAPAPLRYSGATTSTTFRVWGQIQATPSGRLVAMAYAGTDNWCLTSDDKGETWQAHLIVRTDRETDYNEMAIAVASDTDFVAIARGATRHQGGSSMRQFASRDGGESWHDLGWTNADWSGGYVSPALEAASCGGRTVLVWAYMARASRSTPPPSPDSLILRFARASAALEQATVWSPEQILGAPGSFHDRSGYPSLVVSPDCKGGVAVAGRETGPTSADVVAVPWLMPANLDAALPGR